MTPKVIILMADYGHDPTGKANGMASSSLLTFKQRRQSPGRSSKRQDSSHTLLLKMENRRNVTR